MVLSTVPVIDVSPFLEGPSQGRKRVGQQIAKACEDIGFFTIVGHGIPDELIARTSEVSTAFFDLPRDEKLKVRRPSPDIVRGYEAPGEESLAYSLDAAAPADLKESLSVGPVSVPDGEYYRQGAGAVWFAPNLWPEKPEGLKDIWSEYFCVLDQLGADIMRMFAVALELPEHFFDDKIDKPTSILRVINYPEPTTHPEPGQLRAGEHTDYGTLTILRQEDRPGGLQVKNRKGEWVSIKAVPGSFVINIGDLMQMWTNDRWTSNPHRVLNPPADQRAGSRRQSLVFFHQTNFDTVVSCLESCCGTDDSPKHPPVTMSDHILGKFLKQTTFGGNRPMSGNAQEHT